MHVYPMYKVISFLNVTQTVLCFILLKKATHCNCLFMGKRSLGKSCMFSVCVLDFMQEGDFVVTKALIVYCSVSWMVG